MKFAPSSKLTFLCVQFSLLLTKGSGSSSGMDISSFTKIVDKEYQTFPRETSLWAKSCQRSTCDSEIAETAAIQDQEDPEATNPLEIFSKDKQLLGGQATTIDPIDENIGGPSSGPGTSLDQSPSDRILPPVEAQMNCASSPLRDSLQPMMQKMAEIIRPNIPEDMLQKEDTGVSHFESSLQKRGITKGKLESLLQNDPQTTLWRVLKHVPKHILVLEILPKFSQEMWQYLKEDLLPERLRYIKRTLLSLPQNLLQDNFQHLPQGTLHNTFKHLLQGEPNSMPQFISQEMAQLVLAHTSKDTLQKMIQGESTDLSKNMTEENLQDLLDSMPEQSLKDLSPKFSKEMWEYLEHVFNPPPKPSQDAAKYMPPDFSQFQQDLTQSPLQHPQQSLLQNTLHHPRRKPSQSAIKRPKQKLSHSSQKFIPEDDLQQILEYAARYPQIYEMASLEYFLLTWPRQTLDDILRVMPREVRPELVGSFSPGMWAYLRESSTPAECHDIFMMEVGSLQSPPQPPPKKKAANTKANMKQRKPKKPKKGPNCVAMEGINASNEMSERQIPVLHRREWSSVTELDGLQFLTPATLTIVNPPQGVIPPPTLLYTNTGEGQPGKSTGKGKPRKSTGKGQSPVQYQ